MTLFTPDSEHWLLDPFRMYRHYCVTFYVLDEGMLETLAVISSFLGKLRKNYLIEQINMKWGFSMATISIPLISKLYKPFTTLQEHT